MIHTPTTHESGCGCSDCTSGKRNRFFRGKTMRAEEFQIEQAYAIDRRRLLNRSVVGWGVVYGFSVKQGDPPDPKVFTVGAGLALDRHGREIDLGRAVTLGAGNTFVAEPTHHDGCRLSSLDRVERNRDYLLAVHYAERRFGDVASGDDCGCEPPEKKFLCETVAFSLTPLHKGRCPCEECRCRRTCACPEKAPDDDHHHDPDDQAGEHEPQQQAYRQDPNAPTRQAAGHDDDDRHHGTPCRSCGRGPHRCLCEWVTNAAPPPGDGQLCEWGDGGLWTDPRDGVAIACVKVWTTGDDCRPIGIEVTGDCDPRRLVKNNDLLYDLVRGCDLAHISQISWPTWHRSGDLVEWDDFAGMFHPAADYEPVRTDFVVRFSKPVIADTIRRDAVTITAITIEQNSGWRIPRRVPLAQIEKTSATPGLPAHLTDQMRLYVRWGWYHDEVDKAAQSWLSRTGFGVEIEIRGDLILDCHGQAVDANAVGLRPAPTGNGTPGGTYTSSFWVKGKKNSPAHTRTEP